MDTRTRRLIIYVCAAVLVILGLYSLIILKDNYSGIVWTVVGVFFIILGYFKIKD